MKRLFFSLFILAGLCLHVTAKESEEDVKLKELAASINKNSAETGLQAKYEKRCFYVVNQDAFDLPSDFAEGQLYANLENYLNSGGVFKSMAFELEEENTGFLQLLTNAKAKLSLTYSVPTLTLSKTVVFNKEDVARLLTVSTADRKKLQEQVFVRGLNCVLPIPIDEGVTLQSIKITPTTLIYNLRVDESIKRFEDIANDHLRITAAVLLAFCKNKEDEFHTLFTESGLNMKVMFTGMPSRRYFDTDIPAKLVKDVVENDQINDAKGIILYLQCIEMKKKMPIRVNAQRTMKDMWISFHDNTMHCEIEESKEGVNQLNLLSDNPDVQRWLIGYGLLVRPESIKDAADFGASYEYIVKGEGLKDSLTIRFDNSLLREMSSADQWKRDSIEVAMQIALQNAYLKDMDKTDKAYVNSFKVEGQNVVKETMIANTSLYNTIKRYPVTLKREELESSGSRAGFYDFLKRCKRNLVLRYVNKQNTKQSFDVMISYFEME